MIARSVVAAFVVAALLPAAPVSAHGVPGNLAGVGPVNALPNGLYEVVLRTGAPLVTHGVDGPRPGDAPMTAEPRPPRCATTPHVRVLYGRPATSLDGLPPVLRMREAVWRLNGTLDAAALQSGARHADLRVACDRGGEVQVDSFVNPLSSSFADVVDAARLSGATEPDADYLIFYAGTQADTCGVGSFTADDRLASDNANNEGGGYAVVYEGCWDDVTALHEIAHTQGAVQPGAPQSTGAGHCRDELDVMCYPDGAEGATGMLSRCDAQQFDCGYDDYFDVAPEPGGYLETHWNLGSPLNRFIDFTDIEPGEDLGDGCSLTPMWIAPDVCDATDAGVDATGRPVRILGTARIRRGRVRVALRCPAGRPDACRGRLELRARGARAAVPHRFSIEAGRTGAVRSALNGGARRAWRAGRLRRLRAVVRATEPAAGAARTLALRGVAKRRPRG